MPSPVSLRSLTLRHALLAMLAGALALLALTAANASAREFPYDLDFAGPQRVSNADGGDAVGYGAMQPSVSGDGHYVAFISGSRISSDDQDKGPEGKERFAERENFPDVYVKDTEQNTVELVSRADGANGEDANAPAFQPSISRDGRFIAFSSWATNLDSNLQVDGKVTDDYNLNVYVRDRIDNTTKLVSVGVPSTGFPATGKLANGVSYEPTISGNGQFVAFNTSANNLMTKGKPDEDLFHDIYVSDLTHGGTIRISTGVIFKKSNLPTIEDLEKLDKEEGDDKPNPFPKLPKFPGDGRPDTPPPGQPTTPEPPVDGGHRGDTPQGGGEPTPPKKGEDTIETPKAKGGTPSPEKLKRELDEIQNDLRAADGADGEPQDPKPAPKPTTTTTTPTTTTTTPTSPPNTGGNGPITSTPTVPGHVGNGGPVITDPNGGPKVDPKTGGGNGGGVSIPQSGVFDANDSSSEPAISDDGRFITFTSYAENLVLGDDNEKSDIFRYEAKMGPTGAELEKKSVRRISITSYQRDSDGDSRASSVSDDGTRVAFQSEATNLGVGGDDKLSNPDTNKKTDIWVRDVSAGETVRVSNQHAVARGTNRQERWFETRADSFAPSISADGTKIAFSTLQDMMVLEPEQDDFRIEMESSLVTAQSECADFLFKIQIWQKWPPPNCPVKLHPDWVKEVSDVFVAELKSDVPKQTDLRPASISKPYVAWGPTTSLAWIGTPDELVLKNSMYGDSHSLTNSNRSISADGLKVGFSSFADNLQGWGGPTEGLPCRVVRQDHKDGGGAKTTYENEKDPEGGFRSKCQYGRGWYFDNGFPYASPLDKNELPDVYLYNDAKPLYPATR